MDCSVNVEAKLKSYVSGRRYEHSLGTMETAAGLAGRYGCSVRKARLAGLLHDVARDFSLERMEKILGDRVEEFSPVFRTSLLMHAPVGGIIARRDFGIEDKDVIRSIELHTTGGPSMTILNKVLFVADFIEPGRRFRGVRTARRLAFRNIDESMAYILTFTLRKLLLRQAPIFDVTCSAYNEYAVR